MSNQTNPQGTEYPSLNLAFEMTKEQLSYQPSIVDALDSKANFTLSSATVLTIAATVFRGTFFAQMNSALTDVIELVLLVLYAIILFCSYQAYCLRPYTSVPHPAKFEKYLRENEEYTKGVLYSTMVDAFEKNEGTINKKSKWATLAMSGLIIEGAITALTTLLQVWR